MRNIALCLFLALLPLGTTIGAEPELALVTDKSSVRLTASELANFPRESVDVTGEKGEKTHYEGIPLWALLEKANIVLDKQHFRGQELATCVIAHAKDGYEVALSLGELAPDLGGAKVIVADKRDGRALADDQGPLRLVVAQDKRPARSVRMLERIEIVRRPH